MNTALILLGKTLSKISKLVNIGSGSTWPGHIAMETNKEFIKEILKKNKIKTIIIAGTNGKTTTSKLIQQVLQHNHKTVFRNKSGANLLNGVASTVIENTDLTGKIKKSFGIFEIDENSLPPVLDQFSPDYLILLNLFRDQLDRYGEIDTIAKKWKEAIKKLKNTTLILNADDPLIAYIGKSSKLKTFYFGLEEDGKHELQHASDSVYCPKCGTRLKYGAIYFSHLGIWRCPNCGLVRPKVKISKLSDYPLLGTYNKYNTLAAYLLAENLGIKNSEIEKSLKNFKPAFGRQEITTFKGKKVQFFLSKNPTSFNQSLRTVLEKGAQNILIVLNDRIPDGRDVSWIWDFDLEGVKMKHITVSGDRTYDMALRLKYAEINKFDIEPDLAKAIELAVKKTKPDETLYILPTYSAMLEARKIITGKKIL